MIFPEDEEFLAHFGTKGMKWGVRQGKKKTGVTRTRSQKIEKNTNRVKRIEKIKAGKKYRLEGAIGKKLLGKPEWNRRLNQRISDLNAQNKRLSSGKKLTPNDRYQLVATTAFGRNFFTMEIR